MNPIPLHEVDISNQGILAKWLKEFKESAYNNLTILEPTNKRIDWVKVQSEQEKE